MFGFLKAKKLYHVEARGVYAKVLTQIRKQVFYEDYGVPDTFDGRFDLMLVHLFMVMDAVGYDGQGENFNQALFDVTFADMDQTLREMGVGDMGVPKRMRKMMKAFNGRMHVYAQALENGALVEAFKRNLYGTVEKADDKQVKAFVDYFESNLRVLRDISPGKLMQGDFEFLG